jgi:hypothetical protein
MSPNLKLGLAGEYLAGSFLVRQFDEIYPAPPGSRFDFLCHLDGNHFRIQVKTTGSANKHHGSKWCRWDIKKKISNKKLYRVYSGDEVDIFAFVYLPGNIVIFQPNYRLNKTFQRKLDDITHVDSEKTLQNAIQTVLEVKCNISQDEPGILKKMWKVWG